eukprot:Skav211923  [mRNA]  locus=scaffold1086:85094:93988:+ [translate_table: standard]
MEEHAKDSIPEEHPKDSIPHVVEIGDETEVMHDPLETSKPSDSKPPRRSEQPFIFVPFTLWIFADTPILTYELSRENNTDTNATDTNTTDTNTTGTEQSCIVGSATRDYYTNKMLCPVLSSHSNLSHTFTWYGVFLATVAIAFLLGLKIEPDDREKHSPVVRFLDCAPAMYTDRHLLGYFVVITLCFLNSVASKRVALMPGSDLYTCLRYGDWQGDEKLCAPGRRLPKWLMETGGKCRPQAHEANQIEYEFCDVIQSYRKANPVPTDDASKKFSCPAMAHVIFGFLVGFCGFILSCVAPLGDALAWSYYFQDPAGPVAERCKDNDTSLPWNPWCHIARPVPLNRAFFMPKLSGLLLPDGAGIFVCLVLKAEG